MRYLTTGEAARWLGVTERRLREWRQNREGPAYVKYGPRTYRYAMADLKAFRDEHAEQ